MCAALARIAIGSDHGGFPMKSALVDWLRSRGHNVQDLGCHSASAVDYPLFAARVARAVASGRADFGIMIDGAGIGSAMAANKIPTVRAAACYSVKLATNARVHNDARVLTLGASVTPLAEAQEIVAAFLSQSCTEPRHLRRVQMISSLETTRADSPFVRALQETEMNLSEADINRIASRVRQIVSAAPGSSCCGGAGNGRISPSALAQMIDHTLLKPEATKDDILKLCAEARQHHFWSCCVNAAWARTASDALRGSGVKTCCVVGFPLGAMPPELKAMEARRAIRDGAREIDTVMNVGLAKSGDWEGVYRDIRAVSEACMDGGALLKVILETCLLTADEIEKACAASVRARAKFVKTSTGFNKGGATAEDVALMSRCVKPYRLGVKASGGVRSYADAIKMIEAGATRIGCSSSVKVLEEAAAAR
jgi:deoxyribose-phosphate aldolase